MRRAAVLAALLLTAPLSGCFLHTEPHALAPEARGDAPWLEGALLDDDDRPYAVTREGVGLYRLSGLAGEPDKDLREGVALLMGDCSIGRIEDMPEDACSWSVERLCADEEKPLGDDEAECRRLVNALRDPDEAGKLDPRAAATVDSLRWIGEGMPWRDDVLFVVAPLSTAVLGEDWAAAQVRRVGSFGPYSDIGILGPELRPYDLVLLERVAEGGFDAWATTACLEDGDEEAALSREAALETLTRCADAMATGARPKPSNRRVRFRPDTGR